MTYLNLQKINKSFGHQHILKDIDLKIKKGEFIVLVGPSGCGKSTTLRLIAGLESCDSGDIFINEKKVNNLDPADRNLAMVFQNYALYPHLSVFQNMAFGLSVRKLPEEKIKLRVYEAAEMLLIKELLKRKPKELSGGQRQRVALGRAIVRDPAIFLFDEPLSNLDTKLRHEMRVELKRMHKMLKTTMVYVTHDQTEAMTMGDRIAVMKDGEIIQMDAPEDLYDRPLNTFVASFIGTPKINLIRGELFLLKTQWVFRNRDIEIIVPDNHYQKNNLKAGSVLMGLRPEDVYDMNFTQIKNQSHHFDLNVEMIENLGSGLYLHLLKGNTKIMAQMNRRTNIDTDKELSVIIDENKVHFFNDVTGEVLS